LKLNNLKKFFKGWYIGNFSPTLFKTDQFEIAVKKYKKGEIEEKHFHKLAAEYTLIVYGKVNMNGIIYKKNDIITIEPNHSTDFIAMKKSCTVVVKIPSIANDKYIV
jgi:hypothetical protein